MSGFATHRAGAFVLGLAFAAGLLVQNAHAAANAYMQIPGILGKSTDSKHSGWIEVSSFQWGVGRAATVGSATSGAGAGRASMGDIKITKTVDSASPKLTLACANGQHFKSVVIEEVVSGGRIEVITLQDVLISSVNNAGAGGYMPTETITLNFAKSMIAYRSDTTPRMNAMPMMQHPMAAPATQPTRY
ncbi:MAG: type VI secretion system tube protein Hcp [Alphaproteobacteria bacterium]|nr:type VI secretion system tube protein Hcp [Alphaproteobacteria bacterium]MDE2630992.1 type VI secretion system tube protein Hcp [Alphaproteobacteria bacterium]